VEAAKKEASVEDIRRRWIGLHGEPPSVDRIDSQTREQKMRLLDYYLPNRMPAEQLRKMPTATMEQLKELRDLIEGELNDGGVIEGKRVFDFSGDWNVDLFYKARVPELGKTWDWVEMMIGRLEAMEEAPAMREAREEEERETLEEQAERAAYAAKRKATMAENIAALKAREAAERQEKRRKDLEVAKEEARARLLGALFRTARLHPKQYGIEELSNVTGAQAMAKLEEMAKAGDKEAGVRLAEARQFHYERTPEGRAAKIEAYKAKQAAAKKAEEERIAEVMSVREAVPGNWTKKQLLLHPWVFEGEEYYKNQRGDVLSVDGDWVGRYIETEYSDRIDRKARPPPDFEALEAA
jgi:hypothetical protein